MTKYFYARVSTKEQHIQRQIDKAHELGFADKNIFVDHGLTGKNTNRPELQRLLETVQSGDSITCTELSRISRSTKDLLGLSEQLQTLGVDLISIKEQIDTTTPMGRFFFTVSSAFNQLELELAQQRAQEGREAAKRQGKTGGRPKVDQSKLDKAVKLAMARDLSMREVTEITGVSRDVIYRELRNRGLKR